METRLSEFKKNILLWYPFKENSTVLCFEDNSEQILVDLDVRFDKIVSYNSKKENGNCKLVQNDKFDYITIIKDYTYNFEENIKIAKNYLKEDGKILIALNNKFGLKNWNTTNSLTKDISEKGLKEIFEKQELEFEKFYYVFPNFKQANLIYSKDYKLTEEDITRNFSVYNKNSVVHLNENKVYKELLKEGTENVNNFANSLFIEVSKKKIDTNIKYVTFSNYRKPEYRTMTIIKDDVVVKKEANKKAKEHIKQIANNLKKLEKLDVNVIETFENNEFKSKFISGKRFDTELAECNTVEEFLEKFEILKTILNKNILSYNELIENLSEESKKDKKQIVKDNFKNCIKNYNQEKLEKLHFVKEAFIDLVPKNCFLVNGVLNVFDQEWIENNIPVEYIYYRTVQNTPACLNKFGKENLFKALKIENYIDLFEELEKDLCDKTFDYEIHDVFFRQYLDLKSAERQRNIYKTQAFSLQARVEKLEQENHSLNLELEDARVKLVDYANQLRVISNSGSWKLIQKIRKIIGFFNFRNGISLIDRLYPVGTKRREKYDKKQAEKRELQRIKNMKNATDEETVKVWLELEKIYAKRREELAKVELQADSDPYEFWCKANDPSVEELELQKLAAENFAVKPKISILVPLYNTPVQFFRELLFTIYNQTYSNWELCLADGSPEKLTEIEKMCKDSRIKYHYIGENKGISGNTNEALKLATGDYISLLDHDDLLTLNSLFEIVKCINENPEVKFIYTDEDKIEAIDKPRYDPHFKPDYAPDFLMSGNYICHFSVFKKELMNELEGFRSEYDGAQDFDIILRATEISGEKNIKHIPKILYHWRIHPGSTAGNSEAKLYAYEAGVKAVQDHLKRIGSNGIAKRDENINGFYKVTYPVIGNPKVNILITNRNQVNYLKNCIESILEKTTYSNYEIDIIDNNSDDFETLKYYEELEKNKNIKIFKYSKEIAKKHSLKENNEINSEYENFEEYRNRDYFENANYSELINFVVKQVDGEIIVELDKHTKIVTENWLETMIGIAQRKEVGCVGAKVYYSNGTIKHAGIVYGIGDYAVYLYRETYNGHRVKDRMICNTSIVSSICRAYRKEVFEEIQGMNENINFELINEVDFSLRLREKGYLNIYTPQVEINDFDIFNERERIEEEDTFEYKKEIIELKSNWQNFFAKPDPYHNINFSPASSNCVIRIDKI